MNGFKYTGARLKEVRFPLGGIGAGCVSIDGGARLVDWEIHNRPKKESYNGFSHIAVKAEQDGKLLDARALNGPYQPPYMGKGLMPFAGYTYGPERETMVGVPHFTDVELVGRFPIAEYSFTGSFPGNVHLKAWSPFEPNNDFDSSLPLGMFEVSIANPTEKAIDYSIAFTLCNPDMKRPINRIVRDGTLTALIGDTGEEDENSPAWGQVCVATDAPQTSVQHNWYRGNWFDGLTMFWKDFKTCGPLKDRVLEPGAVRVAVGPGNAEHGVICAHMHCEPGQSFTARFSLSWYYPNYEKYWGNPPEQTVNPVWRNWYATVFEDAQSVATYGLREWDRLYRAANQFVDALYNSTLPEDVIDAAGSTLAVLKSPTCLRLTDGSFYAWEGSHARDGSCEGSCQHVWNYQYALPMLFPALERSMRELDFLYNLKADGTMTFRLQLPIGAPTIKFRACADGQLGAIIKTYREWKLSGDDRWLGKLWPYVKRALEFTWSPKNPDLWDPERSGVLTGRQHQTLDMELFGPNSWLTGMYLAALESAARMARAMGDDAFAEECTRIKVQGMRYCDEHLFNGEYFIQQIDIKDRSILDRFAHTKGSLGNDDIYAAYWNDEVGEIKYQVAQGSSIDQLLGQWHADLCGLGELFDAQKVSSAVQAIYRYNYMPTMEDFFNPCRIYCLQDEGGLLICAYPEGTERPYIAAPYAEETMHGFEYSAASLMIMRGLEQEGLECVRALRARYDGERRNPWNEIECGGNYARSMAAWALVLAYQGLHVDMTKNLVSIQPLHAQEQHRSVWSFGGAWGQLRFQPNRFTLECFGGHIEIQSLHLPTLGNIQSVKFNGDSLAFGVKDGVIELAQPLSLTQGSIVNIEG